jgi:hypothetical protein
VPIARLPTRIWLVLGVFLAATVLGTPLAARRLAAGRAEAWTARRPPRRARFDIVGRTATEAGALAVRRIEPEPRRHGQWSAVAALSESVVRQILGATTHAATPAGPMRLRC